MTALLLPRAGPSSCRRRPSRQRLGPGCADSLTVLRARRAMRSADPTQRPAWPDASVRLEWRRARSPLELQVDRLVRTTVPGDVRLTPRIQTARCVRSEVDSTVREREAGRPLASGQAVRRLTLDQEI